MTVVCFCSNTQCRCHVLTALLSPYRSGNGGNGGGGGSFLSYLQEQTGPGWIPVTDPTQAWVGNQPKPRQAMDIMMSSVRNAVEGDQSRMSQEALLQPVRDMGHSEILRGHFRGTQPFEKGLGFPHRVPELRAWDDMRLKGQVSVVPLLCKIRGMFVLPLAEKLAEQNLFPGHFDRFSRFIMWFKHQAAKI